MVPQPEPLHLEPTGNHGVDLHHSVLVPVEEIRMRRLQPLRLVPNRGCPCPAWDKRAWLRAGKGLPFGGPGFSFRALQ